MKRPKPTVKARVEAAFKPTLTSGQLAAMLGISQAAVCVNLARLGLVPARSGIRGGDRRSTAFRSAGLIAPERRP